MDKGILDNGASSACRLRRLAKALSGLLVAFSLLSTLSGCSSDEAVHDWSDPTVDSTETATVRRGTITSVVTADGIVAAAPEYAVPSSIFEQVWFAKSLQEGKAVEAGQTLAWQRTTELTAPTDGAFVRFAIYDGMKVEAGVPVAVIRYGGYAVQAELPMEQAYRLYEDPISARVQVTGGPGPSDCTLVDPADGVGSAGTRVAESVPRDAKPMLLMCLLHPGTKARAGLPAILGITTGERIDTLLLPTQAVAGDAESGVVTRLVDGELVETEVKLGISDGVDVEILDGLDEGDMVLAYGPHLRTTVR
ncbi:efflux RND transporter periplasmic adaptor subunit [Solwaraspora sp. WMMD792]|uniref:efflux RND transporter periplasmic adaptor subunit n=1 Tax=Solwaraspora sp. WMMD792 TaxID=3016099 RepID=UPI002415FCC1|nr:efflux RND transporter periplasmic adaptor subunit [Solwaraspora sp. WMMD792]MDG4773992.1 efflux RND transporter periplasmic adaptor subunit [Solwaraspora sp. WMMD792]